MSGTPPRTDGGHPERRDTAGDSPRTSDDGSDDDERQFDLDMDMPGDSLLTREEYLEMYKVAATPVRYNVLTTLEAEGRLSTSELADILDRKGNDLHYHLRKLKRVALIRNRRDPATGTEDTYSYYELTDLGQVVLTEGLATGVEKLAEQEATLSDKFSS